MTEPDSRTLLVAEIRAHLEWELDAGGIGVPAASPRIHAPAPVAAVAPRAPADRPVQPSLLSSDEAGALPRAQLAAHAQGAAVEVLSPEARRVRLAQLAEEVRGCQRCELHKGRTQTVFARGNPDARLVFIGEGPGQEEDRTGQPFVGPAGQLLDKMIAAMGQQRDDVYICNIVKCRPPGNRTPLPSEGGACSPYLLGQLDAVAPQVIVALGRCAAENLGLVGGGGSWRGRWGAFRGIPVMPTYHPAFLLRSPEFKRPVWEDLQKVMAKLSSR
jgi:uracil-DNA glycosylase family 4